MVKWKETMDRLRGVYEMPSGELYEGIPDGTRDSEMVDVQTMVDAVVGAAFPQGSIDDVDRMDLTANIDACLASVQAM